MPFFVNNSARNRKDESMVEAKNGDAVKVHYTGKTDDGTVFDTSMKRDPLQFTIGKGQLIPGFEQAVVGMRPGDSQTTTIPAKEAYGPRREELVMEVERKQLPANLKPEVGQQLQLNRSDGQTFVVTVSDVSGLSVTLDANHALAGKDLTFDIQLTEIL
jgi:peptidylprolyl isomerase